MSPVHPTSTQPITSTAQTVASFSLGLEGFEQVLQAEQPIHEIESKLLDRLESPVRLLRWAIVKVETTPDGQTYWCEGAYLKSCQ